LAVPGKSTGDLAGQSPPGAVHTIKGKCAKSTTPHAYLAATAAGAKILIVVTRPYGSHTQRDIPGLA
jgi:hypothetical protein